MLTTRTTTPLSYKNVIDQIRALNWPRLTETELLAAAWAYYYFSVQFRENLEVACELYPEDANLARLKREECDTSNLSPFPGVAAAGERMDHDEFMRRLLRLAPIAEDQQARFQALGQRYLEEMRAMDPIARALSISSYEDGGLEAVFNAILQAPAYTNPALAAFSFFLSEHIRFDSDPSQGHGSLSRHLVPDESVLEIWLAFHQIFVDFVPALQTVQV